MQSHSQYFKPIKRKLSTLLIKVGQSFNILLNSDQSTPKSSLRS